ncbi:hypothetical protein SSP35_15_00800 [Streptomyces sp. NBRC 110611]|uniref:hypothetical protein n=1 Tax=Streptomyces sp. NBRC 110611 TaxID=1621259 RepID=UPI0008342C59|nr:hypothetical protein [Streptomyces sp. NBRC 110611]GAU69925.1 hypothetical protein SSP35_15_00800 [Streptomyces sp. NBRC 110611]
MPNLGVLVKDVSRGEVGTAVGWDGPTGTVTLAPLNGDGDDWETTEFKPPNEVDRLCARMVKAKAGK